MRKETGERKAKSVSWFLQSKWQTKKQSENTHIHTPGGAPKGARKNEKSETKTDETKHMDKRKFDWPCYDEHPTGLASIKTCREGLTFTSCVEPFECNPLLYMPFLWSSEAHSAAADRI